MSQKVHWKGRAVANRPARPLLQAVRPCGGIGAVRPQARAEPSVNRLGRPSAIHAAASVRNPGMLSRRAAVAAGTKFAPQLVPLGPKLISAIATSHAVPLCFLLSCPSVRAYHRLIIPHPLSIAHEHILLRVAASALGTLGALQAEPGQQESERSCKHLLLSLLAVTPLEPVSAGPADEMCLLKSWHHKVCHKR